MADRSRLPPLKTRPTRRPAKRARSRSNAANGTARYFTYAYSYQNDTETGGTETKYSQCLVCYIPANVKNSCVLVSVNVYPDSAEGFLSEDVLVAEAQKGIAVVSIDK